MWKVPMAESGKAGMEEGHKDQGKEVLSVNSISTNPAGQGDIWGQDMGVKTKISKSQEWVPGKRERGELRSKCLMWDMPREQQPL